MAGNFCKLGKIVEKSTAIFLCDMQEKFRTLIQYFPEVVSVSSRVLRAAKILELPVVVTEQYPKGLGPTVPELGIQDYKDIVPVAKTQFSMLTNDVLEGLKKNGDIKSVVLCGIEAHVCILGTTLSLLEQGYDVHVVVDACSSRNMVDRMYAFERMKNCGAFLTTSESIILGLVGDSAHPKFKEVQKLIVEKSPDSGLLDFRK
ncbi:ISOC2 (predicted) [Pycnogonum litorale]